MSSRILGGTAQGEEVSVSLTHLSLTQCVYYCHRLCVSLSPSFSEEAAPSQG